MVSGCAIENYSTFAPSTYARGTEGYRAPELLQFPAVLSHKADIWAMGCVLWEVILPGKPFESDEDVRKYKGHDSLPILIPEPEYAKPHEFLDNIIRCMLRKDWPQRPTASTLRDRFLDFDLHLRTGKPMSKDWFVPMSPTKQSPSSLLNASYTFNSIRSPSDSSPRFTPYSLRNFGPSKPLFDKPIRMRPISPAPPSIKNSGRLFLVKTDGWTELR